MTKEVKITKTALRWGYVMWGNGAEKRIEFKNYFKNAENVHVTFEGRELPKKKNIDYKYGRISLGLKTTRAVPKSATRFILSFTPPESLSINCK